MPAATWSTGWSSPGRNSLRINENSSIKITASLEKGQPQQGEHLYLSNQVEMVVIVSVNMYNSDNGNGRYPGEPLVRY